MNAKEQIFKELGEIERLIADLEDKKNAAEKQTDLEIAILKKQVAKQAEARSRIDESVRILEALK